MKHIYITFVVLFFLGCNGAFPPKVEYRINPKVDSLEFSQSTCKDKSLKIAQAFSSSTLLSKDMSYALGETSQYVYSASLWSTSPNRAITSEFLSSIRDSRLFKNVQISKSRSRSDIILEVNIEDFMQYFDDSSTSSYVNAVISLSLIDTKSNTTFASKTFKYKADVEDLNARGGVDGLNIALENIIMQSNAWLGDVCK